MRRTVKDTKGSTSAAPALTPRQRQILELITAGYTSREIATQLKISLQTVEVHRFNLMRRLNVRNVAQLIRQALILRYLPRGFMHQGMSRAIV
ncbi:LuxR C-terminal-related transcriptional regulator [Nitrospira sp. Nam74]